MKKQKLTTDEGFSLLEVLVAILIVAFFTTVTMQMIVISAAFKSKAKEYATATNLIQKDLEVVRSEAGIYVFPKPSPAIPAVGATSIPLSSVNGLATGDKVQFEKKPDVYTVSTIDTSTKTVTITPGIVTPPGSLDTGLVSNTSCRPTSASTGLANYLQQVTQGSNYIDSSKTFTIAEGSPSTNVIYEAVVGANPYVMPGTQKKLWLMRNDTNLNAAPYNVLQIRYLVVKDNNGSPSSNKIVARLSSEVIPNASFQCLQ